jgi:uncharacterized RDD family membrane protein YckC
VTSLAPSDGGGSPAGVITRGLAAVVDLIVSFVAVGVIYLGLTVVRFVISPRTSHAVRPAAGVGVAVWFAVAVLYLAAGWVVTGRTLGAQLLGLRVVSRTGTSLRPAVALIRAILCVAFPIGLLWSAASRRNASVQDLLLGTRVRYDWEVHTPAPGAVTASTSAAVGTTPHVPRG